MSTEALARAWDEGHKTRWRRGPDDCQCGAWSAIECGCGEYGTGELVSLNANPYRCPRCEAVPGDNDHCVWDGEPHGWHRCDGIVPSGSNCPTSTQN